jgi:hypothetical protein
MPFVILRTRNSRFPLTLRRFAYMGAAAGLLSLCAFGGSRAPAQNPVRALPFAPARSCTSAAAARGWAASGARP